MKPWYVQLIKHPERNKRGRWVIAREEKRGTRFYDSTAHISVEDSWPATWFRTLELAEAVCEALNAAARCDRVKESR